MADGTYRQAHPLQYVILHWVHLLSMAVLGFSGYFIHYPFLPLRMDVIRRLHFIAAYIIVMALAARVWYAFAGRSATTKGSRERERDYRNFVRQPENAGQLLETVGYYLFLRRTHPPSAKYNPLQKIAYVGIGVLLLAQALTGFALYGPAQTGALGEALRTGTTLLGGLMAIRIVHFFLMWALILVTMVHVYLSFAEDIASVPLMLFWHETVPPETAEELRRAG